MQNYNKKFTEAWKKAQLDRDAEALYQELIENNERRKERGLPEFTPSLELAYKILKK